MVFHEITRDAIRRAVDETRELDQDLVDAQETRRILDRLYGYEVSPVLWKKVMTGLSAGRVQSVATRLVVDRERERIAFRCGVVLGHRGSVRPGLVQREARRRRRQAGRDRQGLQRPRRAHPRRRGAPDRGVGDLAGRGARGQAVRGPLGRGQALPPLAGRAVHDLDAAAGGQPQAALGRAAHDARRPGPLRARLHHLHAYRLHDAVGVGDERRRGRRPRSSTAPTTSPRCRAATTAR